MGTKIGESARDPQPAFTLAVDLVEYRVESSSMVQEHDTLNLTPSSSAGVVQGGSSLEDHVHGHVECLPSRLDLDAHLGVANLTISSNLTRATSRDTLINTLLHHYVQNVASVLQPIKHPRNTYSSIYASTAMAVAQRIPWQSSQQSFSIPSSKVALLYSLLTSSAFQLRGHDNNPEADFLARYCRNQSIMQLQLALDSLSNSSSSYQDKMVSRAKSEEVLSVMLTLVTADVSDPAPYP